MNSISVVPTFVLKVDVSSLARQYYSGEFENLEIPTSMIEITIPTTILAEKDLQIIHQGEDYAFAYFGDNPILGGQCWYNRLTFTHKRMLIPVEYAMSMDGTNYILGIGCMYDLHNTYTWLLTASEAKESIFHRSIEYLKIIADSMHPGKELKILPDWRLLKNNGGTMEKEEWLTCTMRYIERGRIKLVPAFSEFVKISL